MRFEALWLKLCGYGRLSRSSAAQKFASPFAGLLEIGERESYDLAPSPAHWITTASLMALTPWAKALSKKDRLLPTGGSMLPSTKRSDRTVLIYCPLRFG
jgi:hypothetical protein